MSSNEFLLISDEDNLASYEVGTLGRTMNPKQSNDLLSRPAWNKSKKFDMSSLENTSVQSKRKLFATSPKAVSEGGRSTASFKSFMDRNRASESRRKFKLQIARLESAGKVDQQLREGQEILRKELQSK